MRCTLALTLVIGFAVSAPAQFRYPVKVTEVGVGLPPGRFGDGRDAATQRATPLAKRSRWAPLALRLEMKKEVASGALVKVETVDGDGLNTTLITPLISSLSGQLPGALLGPPDFAAVPYARTGDLNGTVTVTLISNDGKNTTLAEPYRTQFVQVADAGNYVVFSLGSRLPGFALPEEEKGQGSTRGGLRNGRVETAAAATVAELPDQWIGYDAADLVVLPTGGNSTPFLSELFGPNAGASQLARREALLEWVRRGGKLLISVGSNAPVVAQLPALQAILPRPVSLDPPSKPVEEVAFDVNAGGTRISERLRGRGDPAPPFTLANLMPAPASRPARTLVPPPREREPGPPAIVQANYGLGRVTLVAFDLDSSPFLDFSARPQVWDYLLREAGSPRAALEPPGKANAALNFSPNAEDEWLAAIRINIDTFEGIPVVSFGWVALFIALYTLVIGPLEYLVLKHVFGRLELTWITFPIIVATVSATAYFTAYAIKGNDLKVNKIDVVDFNLHTGRVTGHSFFTVFSPRIDSYTVGVTPREGVAGELPNGPSPCVGWLAGGSGGGGGIVSRSYDYAPDPATGFDSAGLVKVPIQVWSTKAFRASWVGSVNADAPPLTAELFHPPGDPKEVAGSITCNLPFGTVANPVLIYGGKAYQLPTITAGQRVEIPAGGLPILPTYFTDGAVLPNATDVNPTPWQRQPTGPALATPLRGLTGVLFHELSTPMNSRLGNASLRDLDLSGRVGMPGTPTNGDAANRDEAILVGSLPPVSGLAEAMMTDPAGPSATTLWLKELPSSGKPRPAVPGTLRQETVFRVLIPIPPAK